MYRQNFTAQRLIIIYNKVQKNKQFCLHIVSFYKNILFIKYFGDFYKFIAVLL